MKPKNDLRDDVGAVFSGLDDVAEDFDLTSPKVALAAFWLCVFRRSGSADHAGVSFVGQWGMRSVSVQNINVTDPFILL
jgi:hypothetical protein